VGLVSGILSLIPCLGTVIVTVIALLSPLYIGLVVANMAGQYVHSNHIV
jgi:predicted PurR-regulated permease PerM